jgi:hypothetical protein
LTFGRRQPSSFFRRFEQAFVIVVVVIEGVLLELVVGENMSSDAHEKIESRLEEGVCSSPTTKKNTFCGRTHIEEEESVVSSLEGEQLI